MVEKNKIYLGNNLDILKTFPDNSIDSIVTDPPYGISFMNKKWDYDVPSVELWQEVLRVLKHGGHALVACGTRTQHRMAVNIEDAGFEIRDLIGYLYSTDNAFRRLFNSLDLDQRKLFQMALGNENLFGYLYGSGFPKSLNIGVAIDKLNGVESKTISNGRSGKSSHAFQSEETTTAGGYDIKEAQNKWQGWGTALKPAMELWTLCRKPIQGTVANNVLKYGVGGLNIDGCRVEAEPELAKNWERNQSQSAKEGRNSMNGGLDTIDLRSYTPIGRFPANVIHDGSEDVVKLFPDTTSGGGIKTSGDSKTGVTQFKASSNFVDINYEIDSGSAARFFYTAKASQNERNFGLGGFEDKSMTLLQGRKEGSAGAVMENGKQNPYASSTTIKKNIHPTVKPIDLMQYLVRMITPKGGVCLDPFIGSGTTAVACKSEKFDYIGIEIDEHYHAIAEARIKAEVVMYDIFDFMEDK